MNLISTFLLDDLGSTRKEMSWIGWN